VVAGRAENRLRRVVHAALGGSRQRRRVISPTDFEFISENSQISAVREFMASLPSVLSVY